MKKENMTGLRKLPVWGIVLGVLVIIIVGILLWGVGVRNKLVGMEESVDKEMAQIETQLQRRMDLIPNLVSTVKGYAEHESEVFAGVSEARVRLGEAISGGDVSGIAAASGVMESALGRLVAIAEAYPELKANTVFIGLQDELAGTENRVSKAREDYNEVVASFNKERKMFPSSVIAGMMGFEDRDYFEADEGADEVPVVEF